MLPRETLKKALVRSGAHVTCFSTQPKSASAVPAANLRLQSSVITTAPPRCRPKRANKTIFCLAITIYIPRESGTYSQKYCCSVQPWWCFASPCGILPSMATQLRIVAWNALASPFNFLSFWLSCWTMITNCILLELHSHSNFNDNLLKTRVPYILLE